MHLVKPAFTLLPICYSISLENYSAKKLLRKSYQIYKVVLEIDGILKETDLAIYDDKTHKNYSHRCLLRIIQV